MVTTAVKSEEIRSLLDRVVDPDLPFLTISDIAILRDVSIVDGVVYVKITPTYSGCPAMETIRSDIHTELGRGGFEDVVVDVIHSPAWTTDWMSDEAKRKLTANRIAPPGHFLGITEEVLCPSCSASEVRMVSEFGSTACKSIMVCTTCREPFDHFKAI